jgi:pyrroloquinoline quinone biosynthesis protein B
MGGASAAEGGRLVKLLVLGSGAGSGFPQWNCSCRLCAGLRAGTTRARPRTPSSIALSADGRRWLLVNASPDIAQQIRRHPPLQPSPEHPHSPIRAVVVLDSHLDHVAGLLSLRQGPPLHLYATAPVFDDLSGALSIPQVLEHYCGLRWHLLPIAGERHSAPFAIESFESLRFTAIAIDGVAPPYSTHRHDPAVGDHLALFVEDLATGQSLFFAPALTRLDSITLRCMASASCVIVDGSWTGAHQAVPGASPLAADAEGSPGPWPEVLDALDRVRAARKVLIHIGNGNPILDEDSEPRQALERQGIEVAHDGMQIEL